MGHFVMLESVWGGPEARWEGRGQGAPNIKLEENHVVVGYLAHAPASPGC